MLDERKDDHNGDNVCIATSGQWIFAGHCLEPPHCSLWGLLLLFLAPAHNGNADHDVYTDNDHDYDDDDNNNNIGLFGTLDRWWTTVYQ